MKGPALCLLSGWENNWFSLSPRSQADGQWCFAWGSGARPLGGGQADEGVGMGAPNREARFELPFTATEMASRPINLFIVLLWNQKLSAVFLWGVQGGD